LNKHLGRTAATGTALITLLTGGATALADKGKISDPKGDLPDIIQLAYNNGDSKVKMKMTYKDFRAQNESFYMRWGTDDDNYQVFIGAGVGEELRLNGKSVKCDELRVSTPDDVTTKVVVPRTCLKKAPDKLRFQGIATEGLSNFDETKTTKAIKRG
jgi:hypothetical protein